MTNETDITSRLRDYQTFLEGERNKTEQRMKAISDQPYFERQEQQISSLGNALSAYASAQKRLEELFPELNEKTGVSK